MDKWKTLLKLLLQAGAGFALWGVAFYPNSQDLYGPLQWIFALSGVALILWSMRNFSDPTM